MSASGEINYLNGFSVSIGSSGGCIVRLFGGAEPVHANIDLYEDGSWVITNLSKAGSTFLNGVRVTEPQILIEGDRLAFGSNKFTYTERA